MATDELTADEVALNDKEAIGLDSMRVRSLCASHETLRADRDRLREEIAAKDAEIQRLKDATTKYLELIYAVGHKYPGETRHETALRYIRRAEEPNGIASATPPRDPLVRTLVAPPAEMKDDPYRYGPNQVGNRKE